MSHSWGSDAPPSEHHVSHGRACYVAFCEAMRPWMMDPPQWEAISATLRTAWIAAAKAARAV
jgi:hypothetical protein